MLDTGHTETIEISTSRIAGLRYARTAQKSRGATNSEAEAFRATSEFAANISTPEKMNAALRRGPMDIDELPKKIDAKRKRLSEIYAGTKSNSPGRWAAFSGRSLHLAMKYADTRRKNSCYAPLRA